MEKRLETLKSLARRGLPRTVTLAAPDQVVNLQLRGRNTQFELAAGRQKISVRLDPGHVEELILHLRANLEAAKN